ncbi:MAG: radical SAM protein [Nanoarchaeota archaeon]|nr:radical SAM protein [Nanoarchaeota archaeon]
MKLDVDNHKLMYHPERVAEWKLKGDCFPIYIEIGPTNKCNHRCIFCALDYTMEGARAEISKEVMLPTIKEIAKKGTKSIMFAGEGEPLLHKDICEFVQHAKKQKLDISITTNGVLFNKEKIEKILPSLSWIRFSVDAGTKENYAKIHNTNIEDFEKVLKNIKDAVEFKNKNNLNTIIGVQFLLIPQNIHEVITFAKKIKETGVDNVQIKPYSQHPCSKNKFVVDYKDYSHLEEEIKKLNSKNFEIVLRKQAIQRLEIKGEYNFCHGLPFFCLIDAKGNVIPCNIFYNNEEMSYGNINEESFSKIWEGEKRKKVLNKFKEIGVKNCREICRLDTINRYLYRLKEMPHPHDNFI